MPTRTFSRSTRDLLNTLAAIDEANAGFRSLGDPWADSTSPHGKLRSLAASPSLSGT